jgi:spermidine synthase
MVPLLGLRDSFLVVITIQLFLAVVVIFFSEKHRMVLGVSAVVISVVAIVVSMQSIPRDVFLKTMNTYHYPSEVIYIKDDATGTVTVHDLPDGDRLIAVDGVDVAGMDLMLRTTQKLQGYVPLLMHKNPQKVLQIGFGSGETSGVGLAFGVEDYRIVDICPGVFEAGKFFEEINRGSYKDPRLRKIIMDGKNFVKLTDEKFDIIMNDSTYPGTTGSSALYTYEHFTTVFCPAGFLWTCGVKTFS